MRLAWVDPVKVPDIRERLEGALGELDLFELIGPWPVKVRDEPYLVQTARADAAVVVTGRRQSRPCQATTSFVTSPEGPDRTSLR